MRAATSPAPPSLPTRAEQQSEQHSAGRPLGGIAGSGSPFAGSAADLVVTPRDPETVRGSRTRARVVARGYQDARLRRGAGQEQVTRAGFAVRVEALPPFAYLAPARA